MDHLDITLPDGRAARVTPTITPLGYLSYTVTADDGTRVNGWLEDAERHGVPADARPAGRTHLISGGRGVWLTPDEVARAVALGEAAKAAFDATPEGRRLRVIRTADQAEKAARRAEKANTAAAEPDTRTAALCRNRERLVEAVSVLIEADTQARGDAFDRGELDAHLGPGGAGESYAARIKQARADLAAFDRDHPEVREALKAERAADVQRWANQ